MIYGVALVGILLTAVVTIFSILGSGVSFALHFLSAYTELGKYLQVVNLFFPVDTLINCITITVNVLIFGITARYGFYAVSLIRGNQVPGR